MNPNTVHSLQGFTKVLDTGQLLRKIAVKACVGKRARDNAITRAALSNTNDNVMDLVRQSVIYMQSSSRLTPDKFYKTLLDVTFDWIATSPSGRDINRRVEIHHHHHGSETSRPAHQTPSNVSSATISSAEPPLVASPAKLTTAGSSTSQSKKKRIRVRFATFALRDSAYAPWSCPYSEADCSVCVNLWRRRFRCNKSSCHKHHDAGAHTALNRAEEKFIRAQHPQFKTDVSRIGLSDQSNDEAVSVEPVVEQTTVLNDIESPCSLAEPVSPINEVDESSTSGAVKHTLDWVAEVEEKRGKI